MCGLAGLIGPHADPARLGRMLDAIEHRGPDGRGLLAGPGIAAGMVRLAIIDVEHGDQPKYSDCGEWAVLLNGEIYNHVNLRHELGRLGRRFLTRSDTEVVANAIAHWGDRAFERLDGMFAIAAWHAPTRRMLLARDRFGEKPLYIRTSSDGFAFASEPKGLAPVASLGALDPAGLGEFLTWGYIPAPLTAWEEIEKLEPASVLEVSVDGTCGRARRYWRVPDGPSIDEAGPVDLEAHLRRAVRRTLVSDVEVGVLLSGGIDSTLTAWFASEAVPGLRAFTARFEGGGVDESVHAQDVASRLSIPIEVLSVDASHAADVIAEIPHIYDEPFADQSAIPTTLLCRAVSKHVKVALGGDGGDELFNGYQMYAQADRLRRTAGLWPNAFARIAGRFTTSRNVTLGRLGNRASMMDTTQYGALGNVRSLMTPGLRVRLLGSRAPVAVGSAYSTWQSDDRMADLHSYLPEDILVKVDRASMSTGLEVRTPWLDPALVAWAMRLTPDVLGPPGTKSLPRALVARRFGSAVADRPKQGFSVPLATWLRGPLSSFVDDLLAAGVVHGAGLVDPDTVRLLVERLRRGRDSAARPVWALLVLHLWHASSPNRH